MKVAFMPTNCGGVAFWRCYQFFRKMKEKGIDAYIYNYKEDAQIVGEWEHKFAYDENLRSEVYKIFKYADVSIIQYIHIPIILASILMFQDKFNKKFLAEIDDEVIDTPSYNPAFKGGWVPGNPYEKVVIEHLKASNGIITSTDFLKDYYGQFNSSIDTMPNCIDFNKWNIPNFKRKDKMIRIGWIGGGNHDEDLMELKDIIPIILDKYKNVEFMFVHGVPEFLKDIHPRCLHNTGWRTISKYPEYLASWGFDIGIAPLVNNRFNMAKSNLRWLEYSACSIPTIATNIEPYKKSIIQGKTGLLCETKEDWINSICELIENGKLRKEMGSNANQEIHDKFDLDKVTDKYIKVLKNKYM